MDHSAREQDKKQHTRIAVLMPSLEKSFDFFKKVCGKFGFLSYNQCRKGRGKESCPRKYIMRIMGGKPEIKEEKNNVTEKSRNQSEKHRLYIHGPEKNVLIEGSGSFIQGKQEDDPL